MLKGMVVLALAATLTTGCAMNGRGMRAGHTPAHGVGWPDVMNLAPGVPVRVETRSGIKRRGRFIAADCLGVRVEVNGREEWFAPGGIVRLERFDLTSKGADRVSALRAARLYALVGALTPVAVLQPICLLLGKQLCMPAASRVARSAVIWGAMGAAATATQRPATVFRGPAERDLCSF